MPPPQPFEPSLLVAGVAAEAVSGLSICPVAPNNGTADQSAALNAWFAAIAGTQVGVLPPGVYGAANTVTIPSNVTGFGGGATIKWVGAANGTVVQFGVGGGAACTRTTWRGLTADGNANGAGSCFDFHSTQRCHLGDLEARNLPGGYNYRWLADAASGGLSDFGNVNNAGNHFGSLYAYSGYTAALVHGASSAAVVCNNRLDLLYLVGVQVNGLLLDQWADNNLFGRVELYHWSNGGTALTLNSSASADQGVYNNLFELVTIDAPGLTGMTALSLGAMGSLAYPNVIQSLFTSPAPFSGAGTLLTAASSAKYDLAFVTESPPYRRQAGYARTFDASGTLIGTNVALSNGAASATATLTNAPAAGNPTKWIPINDNGTTRYIPAW